MSNLPAPAAHGLGDSDHFSSLKLLWKLPPQKWPLAGSSVHVWAANLNRSAEQISSLEQVISADERERSSRFKTETDRNQFIAGRGLLRTILSSYEQADPARLCFQYNSQGKPTLKSPPGDGPLHFNVAHSKALILIAVTRACPVGVDVEWIHPINDVTDISPAFCSRNEIAKLLATPVSQRMNAFFNLWTRKEAYLKATGDGLSGAPGEVELSFLPEETPRVLAISNDTEVAQRWTVSPLNPAPGFAAAIAVGAKGLQLSCWQWPF